MCPHVCMRVCVCGCMCPSQKSNPHLGFMKLGTSVYMYLYMFICVYVYMCIRAVVVL